MAAPRSQTWAHPGADALLARLIAEGRSFGEAAAALSTETGRTVTRSAVAGRVREKKIPRPVPAGPTPEEMAAESVRATERAGAEMAARVVASNLPKPHRIMRLAMRSPVVEVAPQPNGKSERICQPAHPPGTYPLNDLRSSQCRFACTPHGVGPNGHRFCGEPVEREGSPYCVAHAAVCFDRRAAEVIAAQRARLAVMRAAKAVVKRMAGRGA